MKHLHSNVPLPFLINVGISSYILKLDMLIVYLIGDIVLKHPIASDGDHSDIVSASSPRIQIAVGHYILGEL